MQSIYNLWVGSHRMLVLLISVIVVCLDIEAWSDKWLLSEKVLYEMNMKVHWSTVPVMQRIICRKHFYDCIVESIK